MFKNFVKLSLFVIVALIISPLFAVAADAVADPNAGIAIMDSIYSFLSGSQGVLTTILGFLFVVAKVSSNEKAGKIVGLIQMVFDGLAKIFQVIADMLAHAIKSDGLLGKK